MRTDRLWELLTRRAFVAVYDDLAESLATGATEPRDETAIQMLLVEMDEAADFIYDAVDAATVAEEWHKEND